MTSPAASYTLDLMWFFVSLVVILWGSLVITFGLHALWIHAIFLLPAALWAGRRMREARVRRGQLADR